MNEMEWHMCKCVDCVSGVSVSSVSLKGGSQERKGQKGTGGGRTGYGKRDVVTTLSPPPPPFTEKCGNNSLEFHLGSFISLQTGNYAGYVHEIKSISETSSYLKNCTEMFQNWQLCIVCDKL